MKCRIPTLQEIANDAAEKAIERSTLERSKIFEKATRQIVPHVVAYCLRTLELKYGFREKRLNDFVEILGQVVKDSLQDNDFSSSEIIKHMKDVYGIDIENSEVV